MAKMAVRLSFATNTGIDYFKSLPLEGLFLVAEDISEAVKERKEGSG